MAEDKNQPVDLEGLARRSAGSYFAKTPDIEPAMKIYVNEAIRDFAPQFDEAGMARGDILGGFAIVYARKRLQYETRPVHQRTGSMARRMMKTNNRRIEREFNNVVEILSRSDVRGLPDDPSYEKELNLALFKFEVYPLSEGQYPFNH